jgi:hypothetical protein
MYFAVGGRKTQSGVYRVTYVGDESTAPAKALPLDEEFKMRAALESYHTGKIDPQKALNTAWGYLSHSDRHVRYAARVAIEKLPVDLWKEKALNEKHPVALIEGIIALARVTGAKSNHEGGKPAAKPTGTSSEPIGNVAPENAVLQGRMLLASAISKGQKTPAQPATRRPACVAAHFDPPRQTRRRRLRQDRRKTRRCMYPAEDPMINRELCQILVAIDSPKVVSKTLGLMATAKDDFQEVATDAVLSRNDGYANAARAAAGSRPNAQQISYMFALRNATAGWTPEHRKTFFSWFPRARTWKGGNSFKGFIENIRKDAMATFVPQPELAELDALSNKVEALTAMPNYVAPKGPGKAGPSMKCSPSPPPASKAATSPTARPCIAASCAPPATASTATAAASAPTSPASATATPCATSWRTSSTPAKSSPTNTTATRSPRKTAASSSAASSSKRTAKSSS